VIPLCFAGMVLTAEQLREKRAAKRAADEAHECVCYCRLPPFSALSGEELALGGPPAGEQCNHGSGAVPVCRVHGVRRAPQPLPGCRTYNGCVWSAS
jgi:hypothetical protein